MDEAIRTWNSIIAELKPQNSDEFYKILPQAIRMLWDKAVQEGKDIAMGERMDEEMRKSTEEYEKALEEQLDEDRKARKYVRE